MSSHFILLSILGAVLIGAISPGPSFVLVSRIAMTSSRRDGLAAALGMGIGGAIFATLALAGVSAILTQVDWLYLILKFAGGAYLIYLGLRIWRGAREPFDISGPAVLSKTSRLRAFSFALVTQLSNPKTAVVYAGIFAALLPAASALWLLLALPPLIFVVEAGWYAFVAMAFSAKGMRSAYLGSKIWIDRAAGAVMGLLGARLIFESARTQAP